MSMNNVLKTCNHSDAFLILPIQLITNNSAILPVLETYLPYTKPSNLMTIDRNLYAECSSTNVYLLSASIFLSQCCNKKVNNVNNNNNNNNKTCIAPISIELFSSALKI